MQGYFFWSGIVFNGLIAIGLLSGIWLSAKVAFLEWKEWIHEQRELNGKNKQGN